MLAAINRELEEKVNDKAEKIFTEVMEISGCTENEMQKIFTAEELGVKPKYTKEDLERFAKSDSFVCRAFVTEHAPLSDERLSFLKKTLGEKLLGLLNDALRCYCYPASNKPEVIDAAALRLLEV